MLRKIWPKIFSTRNLLIPVFAFQVLVISGYCADAKDPWQSVRQLPHHSTFMFLERDQTCSFGQITSATDQSVSIHTEKSDITIARANLFRIQRGRSGMPSSPYQALTVIYSGRSSWADIIAFMPFLSKNQSYEATMLVATSDGKVRKGSLRDATDTEIVLHDSFGKETRIPRTEVFWVDYLRIKPLSDDQEYYSQELAWMIIFDPVLYPRMFHLGDRMPVRLYDRALPEDDSPIQCK